MKKTQLKSPRQKAVTGTTKRKRMRLGNRDSIGKKDQFFNIQPVKGFNWPFF